LSISFAACEATLALTLLPKGIVAFHDDRVAFALEAVNFVFDADFGGVDGEEGGAAVVTAPFPP
jgi:hypothetical protein